MPKWNSCLHSWPNNFGNKKRKPNERKNIGGKKRSRKRSIVDKKNSRKKSIVGNSKRNARKR